MSKIKKNKTIEQIEEEKINNLKQSKSNKLISTKWILGKSKAQEEQLAQVLKNDFFRKCYLESGETIFYPRNISSLNPDFKDLIQKSRSVSNLRPIQSNTNNDVFGFDSYLHHHNKVKNYLQFRYQNTDKRSPLQKQRRIKHKAYRNKNKQNQFIIEGDRIDIPDSYKNKEDRSSQDTLNRHRTASVKEEQQFMEEITQIQVINQKSRNIANSEHPKAKSSIKLKHNYLLNNISKAAGQTDRMNTYFNKNKNEPSKDIQPNVKKMNIKTAQSFRSKKKSIECIVDLGEKNNNAIECNNEYFNSNNNIKLSHHSISDSSIDHYIKENIYGSKKTSTKNKDALKMNKVEISRNLRSQGYQKKFNLHSLDMNEKLKHLDAHNSKYGQMYSNNSTSFMRMMQKLEQNLYNNMHKSSMKDLVIQKRRLVSSQGNRFSAIKINRFPNNEVNFDMRAKIENDIKQYQHTVYNKEDKNIGTDSKIFNTDFEVKGDSALMYQNHESEELIEGEDLMHNNCYAEINRMKTDHSPFNLYSQKDKDKSLSQSMEYEQGNGPNKNKVDIMLQINKNKFVDSESYTYNQRHISTSDQKHIQNNDQREIKLENNQFHAIPNKSLGSMTYRDEREATPNSKLECFSPFAVNSSIIRKKNKLIINPDGPYAFLPDFWREATQRSLKSRSKDLKDLLEHRKLYSNSKNIQVESKSPISRILMSKPLTKNKDLDELSNSAVIVHKTPQLSSPNTEIYHKIIKVDNIQRTSKS